MAILVRSADYEADHGAIRAIRFEVFVDEQRVPASIELDDRDPHCRHFLAFDDETGSPIGTARVDLELDGKIGRLAVLTRCRRSGVGRSLMEACHEAARAHGLRRVWCNAQIRAVPFYESLGYRVTGEPFDEAGIEHLRMTRSLGSGSTQK